MTTTSLNYPKYPDIEGLDEFKGKMMHSARWDWSYDLKGKKVGIIGNGMYNHLKLDAERRRCS